MSIFNSKKIIAKIFAAAWVLGNLLPAGTLVAEQSEIEFFEKKIRPVLVKHCYKCHQAGSASVKGGLLLDSRQGLLAGGDSGPAMVPGKPAESILIESLKYESYEMPPAGKLPANVIRDFEQWIQRGAIDPRKATKTESHTTGIDWEAARQFWSFQPLPVDQKKLNVKQLAKMIDSQLKQSLEKSGIKANQLATPERRIRRLYFDLTGLPPSPAQVQEFVNDPTPARWEKTASKLLASPLFGQHWGRHWLDVARYADSNGGDFNATYHNAWRYRDYVINSFNDDKPIDEFFREQVAGDLLAARNDADRQSKLVATGFLMIGSKMLSERDKEKLRFDVVDEQIDTFGKAFLGISLGCARCHDHKFDPIPTADYYAMAGIFQSTQVLEGEMQMYVSDWKRVDLPTSAAHRESIKKHQQQLTVLKEKIVLAKKELKKETGKITLLEENLHAITIDNKQATLVGNWVSSTFSSQFVGVDYVHDKKQGKGKKKVIFKAKLPDAGRYQILFAYNGGTGRDRQVPVSVVYNGNTTKKIVDESKHPEIRGNYVSLGEYDYPANADVQVIVSTQGTTAYVIADAVQFIRLDTDVDANIDTNSMHQQLADLKQKKTGHQEKIKQFEAQSNKLKKQAPAPIPQAIAVQDLESCSDCAVHIRGEHTNPGKMVKRGVLKIISGENSKLKSNQGSGRIELANWLTDQAHPLVCRVFTNRIWMHLFGEGIVRSVDNFGINGVAPSHPKLLDKLAIQFKKNGWSQKHIVHAIVLTKAYQQSTFHHDVAFQKDPENSLLWKARRRPLSSEQLQDSFLLFQQKINLVHGGSTVTHLGKLAVDNNKQANAKQSDSYIDRRAVYQPVLRNQLAEIPRLFDFANPEMVVGKRDATNVPAQALYLLNSKQVRKTSEALVETIFAKHGIGSFSGLDDLYLVLFSRLPKQSETQLIQKYITQKLNNDVTDEKVKEAWCDAIQALLISTEFRYLN